MRGWRWLMRYGGSMLASDLARALDPVWLARDAGIEPDAWQARVLRSQSRQIILNCSRQAGKSTISAILAMHTAVYTPGALVLLIAKTLTQSKELFLKMKLPMMQLEEVPAEIEAESAIKIELDNHSRIIALPGKQENIRGFSAVNLLLVDEASQVPDQLYYAVRPMLAVSGGRIVLLSSPFGKRGFFYEAWAYGGAVWHREAIPATQIPRISPEFLEEERRALGPWFDQEYMTKFVDNQFQLYATEDIEAAVKPDVRPLFMG
jgi:hypothetical protein